MFRPQPLRYGSELRALDGDAQICDVDAANIQFELALFLALEEVLERRQVLQSTILISLQKACEGPLSASRKLAEQRKKQYIQVKKKVYNAIVPGGLIVPIEDAGLNKVVAAVSLSENGRLDFEMHICLETRPNVLDLRRRLLRFKALMEGGNPALDLLYRTIEDSTTNRLVALAKLEIQPHRFAVDAWSSVRIANDMRLVLHHRF